MSNAPSANIEAEQALLGALLYDNKAFVNVDGQVAAEDFWEPIHGRMFAVIGKLVRSGRLADPIVCHEFFTIEPAYRELGGVRYLADLVDRAPPAANAPEYARAVRSAAQRRNAGEMARKLQERLATDPEATGEELLADLERDLLTSRRGRGEIIPRSLGDVVDEVLEEYDNPTVANATIKFGLERIDQVTGGCERGDLVVLGARPSMGKSALACCMAINVSRQGLGVLEVNCEMSEKQMTRRHLADLAYIAYGDEGPTYRDIRRRTLTPDQRIMLTHVRNEHHAVPLRLIKRSGLDLARLRSLLRREKMLMEAKGIRLTVVIIDHVGLISAGGDGSMKRVESQTMLSGALKELAEELDVVILALAQLNRNVEQRDDKRPQLADLRDSGSWEQDADMVIGVYRDAYYAKREREPKSDLKLAEWMQRCADPTVEAIFLKIREGDVAVAKLWSDIARNAIRDNRPDLGLF